MGGAESYNVSVSCVGSPWRRQGLFKVPAPQSQKNLSCRMNSTTCPSWHVLIQFKHMAFLSVVWHVLHLQWDSNIKASFLKLQVQPYKVNMV